MESPPESGNPSRVSSESPKGLDRLVQAAVAACGLVMVGTLVAVPPPASAGWWKALGFLYVFAVAAGTMKVPVTADGTRTSVEYVPHLATVVLLGPSAGALLVLASVPFMQWALEGKPMRKVIYNSAQMGLSVTLAGWAYQAAGADPGLGTLAFPATLLPFLTAVVVYFSVNSWAVAVVVALSSGRSVTSTWWKLSGRMSGFDVFVSPVAYGIAYLAVAFGPAATLLGLVPLFGLRFTYGANVELEHLNTDLLRMTIRLLESQDPYTSGHAARVAEFSRMLGEELGLWVPDLRRVERAALLHDIGKIDRAYREILNQEGPLSDAQWELMKKHPERSVDLLSSVRSLDDRVRAAVRHHHERWDGGGYPDGLEEAEIPRGARIIAVADTVDAMLTSRPYRDALEPGVVRSELAENAGTQFDPEVVDAARRCDLVRAAQRVIQEQEAEEDGESPVSDEVSVVDETSPDPRPVRRTAGAG